MSENLKHILDAIATGAALASLAQIIPVLAALASLLWYCIRFYEYFKAKKIGNVKLD